MKKLVLAGALAIVGASLLVAFFIGKSLPVTTQKVVFHAPAVTEDGRGALVEFELYLRPGNGRVLVDIESASYREDVENSIRKARAVASREAGFNPSQYDVEIRIQNSQSAVGGESAGALFAVALASAFTGHPIRADYSISASLLPDGTLGPVEGVAEKMRVAQGGGATHFIISQDQEIRGEGHLPAGITVVRAQTARQAMQAMLSG